MRAQSASERPAAAGSKSHSAAICERKPDGSKNVILRVAVRPAVSIAQNASRVVPPGATTPIPVRAVRLTSPATVPGPPSVSVSTWPSSGRGASGPRWKTMVASSAPALTSRWRTCGGISRPWPVLTGCASPSSSATIAPAVT